MAGSGPRIDQIDSSALEISHIARNQYRAPRMRYGGDLAIRLADGSARAAALGREARVNTGCRTVKRKDPFTEAQFQPAGHRRFQGVPASADRHYRNTVTQFGFADRRQVQLPGIARGNP